ncbi:DUF4173 domain-containing protein [Paenibacillus sp. MMS20-IR301]|uniref:DUF4173 domain-containing protein n=1 Tax=Paenibacillus sp. MMS20-IR301 TaxID=2895946 RepID=UPI0028F017FF|nr:DUF4173 domain-containing protein [Paenibacillus sp. MMS20-IR301]WNS45889.1 DUF4173 domain-containing protein [Paenibacillus sp. MMS20-IR301]
MEKQTVSKPGFARIVLFAAFLLAIVHQYLFFDKLPGISYPIFAVLFYAFMLYFAKERLRKFNWFSYVWLGSIFLLSLTYVLFANWFFFGLNFLVIPALILLHMTYMLSYRQPSWSGIGLIGAALEHLFPQNLRHWGTAVKLLRRGQGKMADERKQVLLRIVIGLLISAPLLLIVTSLLSTADGVFNQLLGSLPEYFASISFGEGIFRVLWILLLSLGMFGLAWGFVDSKSYTRTLPANGPDALTHPAVQTAAPETEGIGIDDPIIITTILLAVNVVYMLFVSVQFSYLFGAWEGILPDNSTYADYARSGFFELIMVTSINFGILLLSLLAVRKAGGGLKRVIQLLLYILVLCSMVMLYSAYSRLTLYEEAYGYTYIRFLVHAFMIFLGLLLILAAVRITRVQFPLLRCYIVLGLLAYVLMNYIGMDRIIARQNIQRYEVSGSLDAAYLARLSADVMPELIEFSRQEKGILDEELQNRLADQVEPLRNWPSFNLARFQERRALEQYFEKGAGN